MIVLGIDPGSRITGFGLVRVEGKLLRHLDSGPIRLNTKEPIEKRLVELMDRLDALIEEHQPDVMAVEKVFHGVNFKSTLILGYVRGTILLTATKRGVPLAEYAATQVKVAVTGYGRAEKTQVQEMVRILLGLPAVPKPNDVADALAVAICHATSAKFLSRISPS